MNVPLIHIIRKRLPLIASAMLVALGVALNASALMAQSRPNTAANHIPNCFVDNWPPQGAEKQELIDAFNKALQDAAMPGSVNDPGPRLRRALLDTRNNFKAPKQAIKDKLKEVHPNSKIKFPKDLVIIFYEKETEKKAPARKAAKRKKALRTVGEDPNHCYIVVYLEPLSSINAKTPSFQDQMVCCYDPY